MRGAARIVMLGLAALAVETRAQTMAAGSIAPPTREEVQRAEPPPATPAASQLTVEGGPARAACPLAEPRFAATSLVIRRVVFDHLAGLSAEDLRSSHDGLLGRAVPVAALCAIRDAATAILTRAGYVAAVQVLPQSVTDGTVHLDVVMARLVRLEVRGGGGRAGRRLAAALAGLTRQPLFNTREAERTLLLARDLPGYDVRLVLRPAGTPPGDVVGEIIATRRRLVLTASLQNYGAHGVGRWGALASAQVNGVLGIGDRLTLGLFDTLQPREQAVVQAGYDTRLGNDGLTVGWRFTYAWTRPAIDGAHPLVAHTLVGSLEAGYPLRRSQALDLRVAAGMDLIDQDLDYLGAPLTRDRLRVGYLRLDTNATGPAATTADPRWRVAASLELRHGFAILGADQDCGATSTQPLCASVPAPSRIQGWPTATLLRLSAQAEHRLTRGLTVAIAPRLQYAFDPLLSYEQYSGGGYTIGRGYDLGAIVGDSGAGGSAELRAGSLTPRDRVALQPYAFVDAAWTWNRNAMLAADRDRLISAGGGVRATLADRARIDLLLAAPLHRATTQGRIGGFRALVSASMNWSR